MASLAQIRRHPVKGLGEEAVDRVALAPGAPLPWDRVWAIAHGGSGFDEAAPDWRHCRELMNVSRAPELAQVRVAFDDAAGALSLTHPDLGDLRVEAASGGAAICDWIAPIADKYAKGPYRLISAAPQAMTDFEDTHISIASMSSLRALAELAGAELQLRRFRMNLWLEDLAPWEELDWIGREITVGAARFRITARDKRCMATHANPETGARDVEVTRLLHGAFGHMDFGVYAQVVEGGEIAVGDEVAA